MKSSNHEMQPLHGVSTKDAIGMLVADHKQVARLFAHFKQLADEGSDREKADVVQHICRALTLHTQLEEELFYPAVREATGEEDDVDEALVEHAGAKQLIAALAEATPDDDLYDARVTVLGEQIDHHVEEEEGSLFPKARHAGLDTAELGARMLKRREELEAGASPRPPSDLPSLSQRVPPRNTAGRSRTKVASASKDAARRPIPVKSAKGKKHK